MCNDCLREWLRVNDYANNVVQYLLFASRLGIAVTDAELFRISIADSVVTVTTETPPVATAHVAVKGETDRASIRIGYELECDSWDTDSDGELDQDGYDEAISEWVDNHMPSTHYLSDSTQESIREDLQEEASNHINASDYTTSVDFCNLDGLPSLFRSKPDGTVSGPEIVLRNPLSIDRAKEATVALFEYAVDNHGAEINVGCSFHVHLSVEGRKHSHGTTIQALMIDYVLLQAHNGRLPVGLLRRWLGNTGYFAIELDADRYRFVAFRDNLGTWEFRCFGNIDNADDAQTCIDVAVEAYSYAYAMASLHGNKEALIRTFDTTNVNTVTDKLKLCCVNLGLVVQQLTTTTTGAA